MNDPGVPDVTALVVLRSASGRSEHGTDRITSESLHDFLPDPEDVEVVVSAFREMGFSVGPPFGISVAVTAPRSHVEEVFDVELVARADGSWGLVGSPSASSADELPEAELPISAMPSAVIRRVSAIVLESPVELHDELGP